MVEYLKFVALIVAILVYIILSLLSYPIFKKFIVGGKYYNPLQWTNKNALIASIMCFFGWHIILICYGIKRAYIAIFKNDWFNKPCKF